MSSPSQVPVTRRLSRGCMLRLVDGDITTLAVDAIVNAANSSLMGGGGVDGAIHRAGGPQILEECRGIVARQGRCATGAAVMTSAGRMPAKFVIHTVGPVYRGRDEQDSHVLAACYRESLRLAVEHQCESVAFPSISTGAYGYPMEKAARIAVETVVTCLEAVQAPREVVFCTYGIEATALYQSVLVEFGEEEPQEA